MKKVVCLSVGFLFLMSVSAYSKELKIGYADVFKIFNSYAKTKDYESLLKEEKAKKESDAKLEDKKNEIIKMQDKLGLLKGKNKTQEQDKIKEAVTEYRKAESRIYSDLKKKSDEKMKSVIDDINSAVKDYAVKGNFDLIINKNAILYGNEGADITTDVLNNVNKSYQKK